MRLVTYLTLWLICLSALWTLVSSPLCQFCKTTSIARRKQKKNHTDTYRFLFPLTRKILFEHYTSPIIFLFDTSEWVYHAFIHQLFLANHKVPHEVSSFSIFLRTICSKMISESNISSLKTNCGKTNYVTLYVILFIVFY